MSDSAVAITVGSGTNIDTRTEASNGNHRQVVVLGDPSTNAGVAPVDVTAGLKVDLGADNDVTNGGTFAVQVDGAALTSLQLIDDTVYTDDTSTHATGTSKGNLLMAVATPTDGSVDANDIGAVAMTTSRLLKVDASGVAVPITDNSGSLTVDYATTGSGTSTGALRVELPTNGTGVVKLAANSGVDIGDVDVTSVLPGNGATNLGKSEDAVHTSGDVGVMSLGVGNAAQSTLAADGDYIPQAVDTKGNTMNVGNVAHDAVDAGNPQKIGGKAINAEPAAVANLDRADLLTDLVGKLITLPYANPENFVSGCISSAMTGTTSTSLVAAPASGLRNYITQITVSNSHATVGTDIIIQDGSGGTTLYVIPAAAVFGGATLHFPVPLRQPTTATAIYCANVTTGSNTKVSASGYKGV